MKKNSLGPFAGFIVMVLLLEGLVFAAASEGAPIERIGTPVEHCAKLLSAKSSLPGIFSDISQSGDEITYGIRLENSEEVASLMQPFLEAFRNDPKSLDEDSLWSSFQKIFSQESRWTNADVLSGVPVMQKFVEDVWSWLQPYFAKEGIRTVKSGEMRYSTWWVFDLTRYPDGRVRRTFQRAKDKLPPLSGSSLRVSQALQVFSNSTEFLFEIQIKIQGDLSLLDQIDGDLKIPTPLREKIKRLFSRSQ